MRSSGSVLRENPLRSAVPADARTAAPTVATADIASLVTAVLRGEEAAFTELHRRFARVVHGIALARVAASDAEDVVQEVFVRVHRTLDTLRDPAAFPAWICTLARNASADAVRRKVRGPATEPLRDVPAPSPASPDDEVRRRVLQRLGELPEAYRETMLLRLAEGLSGPEIAERTGLTPGSVRVNLCRGMARLRELLSEEDLR